MTFPRLYNLESSEDSSANEIKTGRFNFNDGSPKTVFTLQNTSQILTMQIKIDVPFDGVAPTLTVGTGAVPDKYIKTYQNDPKTADEYETNPFDVLAADTPIIVTIVPSGSTQGSGIVVCEYKKP